MIGLDTNVLVRLIVADDADHNRRAERFIESRCSSGDPGFINTIVLCELAWVLTTAYGFGRGDVARVIEDLMASTDILLEDRDAVSAALINYRRGNIDFSDALIERINHGHGCDATVTFDRKASKVPGFIPVP